MRNSKIEVAKIVRRLMKLRGLTQLELAQQANLDKQTINRIVNAKGLLGLKALYGISKVLGVAPNEISGDESRDHPSGTRCVKFLQAYLEASPNLRSKIEGMLKIGQLAAESKIPESVLEAMLNHDGSSWSSVERVLRGSTANQAKRKKIVSL